MSLLILAMGGAVWAQAPWWKGSWPYRCRVSVEPVVVRAPGHDVAVISFLDGGLAGKKGEAVRVLAADRTEVPFRVLSRGPGNLVRLAFATRPRMKNYFIYLGNPKAGPPPKPLDIKRGLLLETYTYQGGRLKTLPQVRQCFTRAEKAGALQGADFIANVFIGYNLFGPPGATCNRYTGYLRFPDSGEYVFIVSSMDAAFVLVDSRVVVDWPGRHYWIPNIKHRRRARVEKGIRKLEVLNVNLHGDGGVVVAWQKPGRKRHGVIPASAFLPIARGQVGPIERYGRRFTGDFAAGHAGQAFFDNKYTYRYQFRWAYDARRFRGAKFLWRFGDGQTANKPEVDHVYLTPGLYPVTLTVRRQGAMAKMTHRIRVSRNYRLAADRRLDKLTDHAKMVAGYQFDALGPKDLVKAMALFRRTGKTKGYVQAARALLGAKTASDGQLTRCGLEYAAWLADQGQSQKAVAVASKAASQMGDPESRGRLLTRAGLIAVRRLRDAKRAETLFKQVLALPRSEFPANVLALVRIGLGDVNRLDGRYAAALQSYEAAEKLLDAPQSLRPVRVGAWARTTEDFIRRKNYAKARETLIEWEKHYPSEKLNGYSSLLWTRLLLAQKRYAEAIHQAEDLLRVNPHSLYAPELLLLAARSHQARKSPARARELLEKLIKNYPESPLVSEAQKGLK